MRRLAIPTPILVALLVALAAAGAMLAGSMLLGYATNRNDPVGKLVPISATAQTPAPTTPVVVPRGEGPDD